MSERTTKHTFLKRAKEVHGNKYDYSKVKYTTTEARVIIICPEHGEFDLRPRAHYADKRGCPKCDKSRKSGFSHNSNWAVGYKTFYILELYDQNEKFLKVGYTIETTTKRMQKGQTNYNWKELFTHREKGVDGEAKFLKKYQSYKYNPRKYIKGASECLEFGLKEHIIKDAKRYFGL